MVEFRVNGIRFDSKIAEGNCVLIQRVLTPNDYRAGQITGADAVRGIIIRGNGKRGGEFEADPKLLLEGVVTNRRGTLRFYLVPMTPEVQQVFINSLNRTEPFDDNSNDGLEPLDDPSKLRVGTVVQVSTSRLDIWPDIYRYRIKGEKGKTGRRKFGLELVGVEEASVEDLISEASERKMLRGRLGMWRFDGIVPDREEERIDNS